MLTWIFLLFTSIMHCGGILLHGKIFFLFLFSFIFSILSRIAESFPVPLKCTPCQGHFKKKGFSNLYQQLAIFFDLLTFFIIFISRREHSLKRIYPCCYIVIIFIGRKLSQLPLISLVIVIVHPIIYNYLRI